MPQFITLTEIAKAAKRNLTLGNWDYLTGAAETETTLRRNRAGFDRLGLRPRVLTDVSEVSVRRTVLGHDLRLPVMLAPIGSLQVFDAAGGVGVARAAASFGTLQILSSACRPDFETVAAETSGPKIYQLYQVGDQAWMLDQIERTIAAGYIGFCLTVDTQVYSRRERDLLKRFAPASSQARPTGGQPGVGFGYQARITWHTVKLIKDKFDIPLILKGIATAEDASLACEHGVDVVYVSNHGGRQLDHGLGAIDVLPEVVAAVAGRAVVAMDGGIMRGTDILKAIALGADVVGVGRLEGLAMAAGGEETVVTMLEILEDEVKLGLAQLGVTSLDALTPDFVAPAVPTHQPHVLSALPLLEEGY